MMGMIHAAYGQTIAYLQERQQLVNVWKLSSPAYHAASFCVRALYVVIKAKHWMTAENLDELASLAKAN